ncbi:MAG: hypothetical protein IJP63_00235 [Acholeplasmatales bacterium]|nr:hypothetical protein [Acholeplasmatales bacterium]
MKNKKSIITISLIALCVISIFGLLLLALTSCDNKSNTKTNEEELQLNSMELKLNAQSIPSNITYEDEECAGYTIATSFTFTKNIDKKKAVEALKPYMIFYNGKPVHTDSNIVCNINGDWADISVTFPDGTNRNSSTGIKVINAPDGVEFAAVTPFSYYRYACVVDKSTCPSGYDVNKVPLNANKARYTNFINPEFDLNYNDSLQEENEIWSETTIQTGNLKYHHAFANVRILNNLCVDGFVGTSGNTDTYQSNENTNQQIEQQFPEEQAPDINNPENPNYNDNPEVVNNEANQIEEDAKSFSETIKQGFEDFKTNVSENETFRTVTICVSSVIGIALIYVLFLIIRKIWRVIKN